MNSGLVVVALIGAAVGCGGGDDDGARPDAGAGMPDAMPDAAGPAVCAAVWEAPAGCVATDVVGKLGCVAGLQVTPRPDAPLPGYARYDLVLEQPIDHARPAAGTFGQRAILMVATDLGRPLVVATSGYNLADRSRLDEVAAMFGAHELWYEHRYFEASTPAAPADWSKLDIAQAAGDAHRWTAALRWMFPGKWANTGVSKGGMTSVFHRRFFPCDVDATIAYVAPISLAAADPAYSEFLAGVGGATYASCRSELRAFQRRLLAQRADILPLVEGTFTRLPVAQVYEMAVIELPFAMWQYTAPADPDAGCPAIPGAGASPAEMYGFLATHSMPAGLGDDASLARFRAYYHQAAHQLGAPAPYEDGLIDLLQYPGTDVAATFVPPGTAVPYDPAPMPDVRDWVATAGAQMMFVYGEFDPWSTRMFAPGADLDAVRYVAAGGNHGAKLRSLRAPERAAATETLERWLQATALAQPVARHAVDDLDADRDIDHAGRRPPRRAAH